MFSKIMRYSGTKKYLETCKFCYDIISTDWNSFILHHVICYWYLINTTMPIFTLVCFATSYLTKCNLTRPKIIWTYWNFARFNIFLDLRQNISVLQQNILDPLLIYWIFNTLKPVHFIPQCSMGFRSELWMGHSST